MCLCGCAHGQQIIHRDIKPGNLLLTKDRKLKVADFSVSYVFDGEDDTVASTAGTAPFLAPELCSGVAASGKVRAGRRWIGGLSVRDACLPRTQMVDMWAVGVTMYFMLAGRLPFVASTVPEVYERILVCGPPSQVCLFRKRLCLVLPGSP